MRWNTKESNKNTEWHKVFAWLPKKMSDGSGKTVWFENVERKYKLHADSGKFVYRLIK